MRERDSRCGAFPTTARRRTRSWPTGPIPCLAATWRSRHSAMPLSDFPMRTSIAVSDIERAAKFYEEKLRLPLVRTGPSADIIEGGRVYRSGGEAALNVFQSATAGKSEATMATWYVGDLDAIVDELASAGVRFVRYDQLEHDA